MILCVEDDAGIRDLMIYALNAAGFEARGLDGGRELFEALSLQKPELILLDIMLPGQDGIEILERLRANQAFSDIPVIMATARGSEYDKVKALDLGADDYLAKPFGMMEMVSRVRAVLRRYQPRAQKTLLQLGSLILNRAEHTVSVDGEPIWLTLKEFEILSRFLENPGLVFTRDHLLESVWGHQYLGETRTVDVHIGTLRAKLGPFGKNIETVRGVGYRLRLKE